MIKGYDSSITAFIDAITQNNFSILTKKITKEIYHLYYTYTEITNKVLNLNLILKLKFSTDQTLLIIIALFKKIITEKHLKLNFQQALLFIKMNTMKFHY